jgi:hypothetical protein
MIAGLGSRSEAAFEAVAQESTHGGSPQPLAGVGPRHVRESVLRLVVFFGFQPATDGSPSSRSLQRRVSRPIAHDAAPREVAAEPRSLTFDCGYPSRNDVCIVVRSAISRANCLARCNLSSRYYAERLHQKQQQFAGSTSVARSLRSSLPASAPPRAEANVPSRSPNKTCRAAPH